MSPFLLTCYLTQRNAVKFVKRVFGGKDVEAILQRLDRLTQDEARTTAAQSLEVIYGLSLDGKASVDRVREALGMFYYRHRAILFLDQR